MTGLALHADPTCVPFFRHDGRQVGAAWGAGPGQELHVYAEKGFKSDGYD